MGLSVVILAAGQGKRMRSDLPKVLHRLAGKPLVQHVVDAANTLEPDQIIVVIGHGGEQVRDALSHEKIEFVEQLEQKGTGHAVACALPLITDGNQVLVLYGDVPMIQHTTLRSLCTSVPNGEMGLLTAHLKDSTGYGRIVRDKTNELKSIVEHRDATPDQLDIKEVNTGIVLAPQVHLEKWLPALSNDNSQGEYYLTDIIKCAVDESIKIITVEVNHTHEILGVNDKLQLAELERYYQRVLANTLMTQGVTLMDPKRIDVRGEVEVGQDVVVDVNVIFKGKVTLGSHCHIGASCILKNVTLGENVRIEPFSHLEDVYIENDCVVGPYARLRPGAKLAKGAKVGNFVEVKKAQLGEGVKVNHLSYIGDAEIGAGTNVGAGTITCNYDGVNKFKTTIGKDVFVGSDCQLIAPVTVGDGATIGAGSTISKDVPENELTLSRSKQMTVPGWQRPKKQEQ